MGISDDHDILTDNGWINISHITMDSYVATCNPLTGCVEYHKPNNLYNYNNIGPMYNILNDNVDLCATPSQPICVSKIALTGILSDAIGGADNTARFYLDSGSNLLNLTTVLYLSTVMLNKMATMSLYTFFGTNTSVAMDKWLPFFGLYLRYGTIVNATKYYISLTTIPIDKLVFVANGLNNELKKDISIDILSYNIDSNGLATTILKVPDFIFTNLAGISNTALTTSPIPQWCYRLGAQQLLLLLCDRYIPSAEIFSSQNKYLIDALQALYLLTGKPLILKQQQTGKYYLDKPSSSFPKTINQFSSNFVGQVYELSVPNFIFMIRRNGKSLLI